jgi:hypothetical protein
LRCNLLGAFLQEIEIEFGRLTTQRQEKPRSDRHKSSREALMAKARANAGLRHAAQ